MATAKIQIKIGSIEFSGEGEEAWVAIQLEKFIGQVHNLAKIAPQQHEDGPGAGDGVRDGQALPKGDVPLGAFLKTKNVGTNQVKRFLATAIWLSAKGQKTLATSDVTKALKDNHQSKLTNPADSLNQNVGKGFCVKDGRQFYVTPEGIASLG